MKSIFSYVLLFLAFFFIFPTFAPVYADDLIIQTDHLNVREGPSTDFDRVTQVHKDSKYPIIQIQNEWIEIELDNGSGWVTKDYVEIIENEKNETKALEDTNVETIVIINDNTQIRQEATTDSKIIAFAELSTEFKVTAENNEWYEVVLDTGSGYIYKSLVESKQRHHTTPLKDKVIVIDAGHGGYDVGSIGVNGAYEKDITYKTTQELTKDLSVLGAQVILTRQDDNFVRLGSRASLSNIHDTDAFISIHYNSFPELPSVTGISSFYYHDKDKQLAEDIQNEIVKVTEAKDRDIEHGNFQVLRQNFKPAVLLELDFISNPEMEQLLLTNAYQKKLVKGIINGLTSYFQD